jgi:NADH-quinone oxidoreductase subunit J
MALPDTLFYIFGFLTLLCGVLVVVNPTRSPVNSAMFLLLAMICMSGLFVLLHAFFLAAIQILVYAGAVMVVFIFIIMLLNLPEEQRRRLRKGALAVGLISVLAILGVILGALGSQLGDIQTMTPKLQAGAADLGRLLFTKYLLPFEIVSVLLLVAMVGVILLSKRDLK